MKNNLKRDKWKILASLLGSLLPMFIGMLLWDRLPENMAVHFNISGKADHFGSKNFAVFILPSIITAMNLLALLVTLADKKQKDQNGKVLNVLYLTMPFLSLLCCGALYSFALGKTVGVELLLPCLIGVMFLAFGNYLPKTRQNSTFGIRIYWTLHNEENWNLTHRFAGKVWVAGGAVILLSMLLPMAAMWVVILLAILAVAVAPIVRSYCLYCRHKAAGVDYSAPPRTRQRMLVTGLIFVAVLCVLVFVWGILFTGDISVCVTDTTLQVTNSYISGVEIAIDAIDSVELRHAFEFGVRGSGFGSLRLSMGVYQNGEFDAYTLYAYNSCDTVVLIRSGEKVLAVNAQTEAHTAALYEQLRSALQ